MSLLELISALVCVVGLIPIVMGLSLLIYVQDEKQKRFCLGITATGVLMSSISFIILLII